VNADEVARCLDEGRTRWPDVATPDDELAPILAHKPWSEDNAADLFVAAAAALGDPRAGAAIHQRLVELARTAVSRVVPPGELDDVVQTASERLLVTDARVAGYTGRGPLDAWLRTVLLRTALTARRRRTGAASHEHTWLELPVIAGAPELAVVWQRHAADCRAAFEAAFLALSSRGRLILRQHFVDGLSADQLGRIYRVHRITAYRWIAQAKADVLARLRIELARRIGLSEAEVDSLLRGVRSAFSITAERVLAD